MRPTLAPINRPGFGQPGVRWRDAPYWVSSRWNANAWRIDIAWIVRILAMFIEAERGRFVLWLPVFMGSGVLAYYALHAEPPPWISPAASATGFAVAFFLPRWPAPRAIAFSAGFAAL